MLKVVKAVGKDLASYIWPLSKKWNAVRAGVLVILLIIATGYFGKNTEEVVPEIIKKTVDFGTVADIGGGDGTNFVGTVRAVSEAEIQSESAGRVTSVRVKAGDTIRAGTIIATLENSAESAAVLQAQGSYEAALAAVRQTEIGATQTGLNAVDAQNAVVTAENAALSAYEQAYTTTYSVIGGTIDQFYSQPRAASPFSRIGNTSLNSPRANLSTALERWENSRTTTNSSNLTIRIDEAKRVISDTIALTEMIINQTNTASQSETLNGQPLNSYTPSLTSAKASLEGTLQSLRSAESAITSAKDQVIRTNVYDPTPQIQGAEANVKQALGALRSAQSRLSKTILRSPISGTVNSLTVNTGDFISAFTPIAEVANNGSLEISIFVGENDLQKFSPEQEVLIEGDKRGLVTSIAPAVDSQTLKTEVKIASDDNTLINGDTVTVTLENSAVTNETARQISVPLNAVRFVGETSSLMTVDSEGRVVEIPVTLGTVSGTNVLILEGADPTTRFIFDVRGLTLGQEVTVKTR